MLLGRGDLAVSMQTFSSEPPSLVPLLLWLQVNRFWLLKEGGKMSAECRNHFCAIEMVYYGE